MRRLLGFNGSVYSTLLKTHVHVLLEAHPKHSPRELVGQLKGYSSHALRSEFSRLKRLEKLWSRSSFVEAVGTIGEETVQRYIETQWKSRS